MITLLVAALSSISSSEAAYDGNGLKLTGNVVLEHPMGKMEAEEALLDKPINTGRADESFNEIHLLKAVHIALKERGQIFCEKANFDLTSLKGALEAKAGGKIHYTNQVEGEQPLELECLTAQLQFEPSKEQSPILNAISALGAVEIIYGDGFRLHSEAADFKKAVLTAYSPSGKPCRLTHGKDSLEAERLQLYPQEAKIAIQHPKGTFRSLGLSENSELEFQCDELVWDHNQRIMHFNDAVVIREETLGTAASNKGSARLEEDDLSTFELEGDVRLTKSEERCGLAHRLIYAQNKHTVILTAKPGERVLFWDRTRGLAISATEVHISKDPRTQDEIVKGIGNVRFHFSSAENALLKKLFPGFILPENYDNFAG